MMFELATKSGNTITLMTDYKKITSKQMKAIATTLNRS